jgi:hypothetical protein
VLAERVRTDAEARANREALAEARDWLAAHPRAAR